MVKEPPTGKKKRAYPPYFACFMRPFCQPPVHQISAALKPHNRLADRYSSTFARDAVRAFAGCSYLYTSPSGRIWRYFGIPIEVRLPAVKGTRAV